MDIFLFGLIVSMFIIVTKLWGVNLTLVKSNFPDAMRTHLPVTFFIFRIVGVLILFTVFNELFSWRINQHIAAFVVIFLSELSGIILETYEVNKVLKDKKENKK